MQYLAVVNKGPATSHVTEQILEANPLLESFGNAKTTKNDNSSRFGKYTEVFFSGGCIVGARITDYLLEKSRIVHQAQGERNYHVFYEMLVGMSQAEKAKYGLQSATGYNYLNQGGNPSNGLRNDAEEFQKLDRSLDVLNFRLSEKKTIFSILAAILHLGNIDFRLEGESLNTQEKLAIANHQQLDWAAKLLHLSASDLEKALIFKVTATATERILTERSIEQAAEARDGIAKSLYTCLFEWLVSRINSATTSNTELKSIAILDIYGFEVFTYNSFEQLCINHANEYLQFFFNRHIFQLEQMEYQKEKVQWVNIEYTNNQPALDLMTKRPNGIFHLLDDESNFPQGSDKAFLDKCHYHHTGHSSYSQPKTTPMCFVVAHYAGKVTYDVEKFIEKNRDVLKADMIAMFQSSGSEIISGMFHSLQQKEFRRASLKPTNAFGPKKIRASTVATKFCESLDDLLSSMNRCNPYFVRCIKPNVTKSSLTFDTDSVIEQLRYSGMLETVRIRKAGFPIRITFKKFAERYRFLVQTPFKRSPKDMTMTILNQLDPKLKLEYRVGISKIFLKEYFENYLERKRNAIISKSVVVIQQFVRGFLARRRYKKLRQRIVGLQAHIRGMMVRRRTRAITVGLVYIQARTRGFIQRRRYARMLAHYRHEQQLKRLREEELARQRAAQEAARARQMEAEAAAQARRQAALLMQELDTEEPTPPPVVTPVVTPVTPVTFDPVAISNMEIPHPLHVLLQDAEEEPLRYNEKQHVVKVPGAIPGTKSSATLPANIEDYPLSKYISIHFKTEDFGYSAQPLKTSLHKLSPEDEQRALAVNKLILRFIHDVNQPSKAQPEDKTFIVGSYIVQQCIANRALRDEVYCQLCSLSWCNPSDDCNRRVWLLLSNLLAVCPPSTTLKNYLLKYISDHAFNGYKSHCQHKLLNIDPHAMEFEDSRSYPPTLLEWKAHQVMGRMTLATWFNDRQMLNHEVQSWITGNDFAKALLQQRGVTSNNDGWSISMLEGGVRCELSGSDYVLDLIGEIEAPPKMVTLDPAFLVSSENVREIQSRRSQAAMGISARMNEIQNGPRVSPMSPNRGRSMEPPSPSTGGLYPANYPKPDYELEKYQADRLRKRNAEGEPIYARVQKKNRPVSLVIEGRSRSAEDEFVDDLFGDIGANDEPLGLDSPDVVNHALRGGGDTPSTPQAPAFFQPAQPIPAQPMYAAYQPPPMYPQPSYMPVPQPSYVPVPQPMAAGMVPMMPQPTQAPGMQQALMAQQMQMQSMQTQQMLQNLQQQITTLQAGGVSPGAGNAKRSQGPPASPQKAPSDDQAATIRKLEREIENLKKQQAREQAGEGNPQGRPKSALKWPDNWDGGNRRSIKFDEDVRVIPHEMGQKDEMLKRRKTPAVLPSYEGNKVQLPPEGNVPPPPPPPPEPVRLEGAPMVLRSKKGNLIPLTNDKVDRARTVRVGAVVWPPRTEETKKQDFIPGREIGNTTKKAKDPSTVKFEIKAAELDERSKNLRPTKTREPAAKVGQVTEKPPVVVAKKKAPPPPPKRLTPTKKKEDEVNHHAEALKILMAKNAFQKPPPEPVKKEVKKVAPPPPPPTPKVPPTPPPAQIPPRPPPAPVPILKRAPPPAPALPPRDPGMQRAKGSAVLRAQQMLGKADKPVVAAAATVSTVAAVQIKKLKDCEDVETRMFKPPHGDYYGYHRVPWTIQVRKEVFIPGEVIGGNELVRELIFMQIVIDVYSNSCVRMTKAEKRMMRSLLVEGDISELNVTSRREYAPRVIEKAQQLSFYFCRFFPVTSGSKNIAIDYIGVSHHSIVLVQRSTNPTEDHLRAVETFEFSEVREVKATTHGNLRIVTVSNSIIPLYTRRAVQVKNMIDGYITFLRADSRCVRALRDYTPNESSLLGFQAGDIIKVREHEVIQENKDWMFGVLSGKTGFFPSQFVEPMAGQALPSPPRTPVAEKTQRDLEIPGRLSMEEFAMKYFREIPDRVSVRKPHGSKKSKRLSLTKDKKRSSLNSSLLMEYKGLVSFVSSPIIVSLLPLESEDNRIAVDCFVAVMQIMGDYMPPRRSTDGNADKSVLRGFQLILNTVREHESLIDEIYCQAVKQTGYNNPNSQSCLRGWRLLYILTMYARCSDNLKPYLFHHLEDCSTVQAENKFSAMANSCLQNLKKTFKHGGRGNLPSREEILFLIKEGRMHKQHPFLIPASYQKSVRVKGNTLVREAVMLLCAEMNVVHDDDIKEFGALLVTVKNNEQEQRLLDMESYLLDAVTRDGQTFILVRTMWRQKLKIENQLLLSLLFTQVKQEYLRNRMMILSNEGLNPTLKEMIAFLGAILLRASHTNQVPTLKDLPSLLPSLVFSEAVAHPPSSPQQWLNLIQQRATTTTSRMTPNKAMLQFLHLMENAKLYGSTFFEIRPSTNQIFSTENCTMAVNKSGVHFLDTKRYVLLFSYDIDEVISATPFTTDDGRSVLKITSGSLQDLQGEHYELEKTEQASLLIREYLEHRRGQAAHSFDDGVELSMAERRAAVEEVISKPVTRNPSFQSGGPSLYARNIDLANQPELNDQQHPPLETLHEDTNRYLPNGPSEPAEETTQFGRGAVNQNGRAVPNGPSEPVEAPAQSGRGVAQQNGRAPQPPSNGILPNGPSETTETPTQFGHGAAQQYGRATQPPSNGILPNGPSEAAETPPQFGRGAAQQYGRVSQPTPNSILPNGPSEPPTQFGRGPAQQKGWAPRPSSNNILGRSKKKKNSLK